MNRSPYYHPYPQTLISDSFHLKGS